jgi:hypothetical protein
MGGRRLIVVACLAALLLAAAPADARKARRHPCNPRHSTTEFDNGTLRLFFVRKGEGYSEYVCGWQSRKRFFLSASHPPDNTEEVRLYAAAGRFFAYFTQPCTKAFCNPGTVGLIDIRSGRRRNPPVDEPAALALTPAGTIGYSTEPGIGPASRGIYVLALGAPQPEQLDAGADIDPQSLALAGHTLYWTRAGEPRSTQIP